MDPENTVIDSEVHYPMLVIPKKYISLVSLVTGSEVTENIFIDLNITSAGSEGNNMCIYSGYCNMKLVDTNDGGLQPTLKEPEILDNTIDNSTPIVIKDLPIMDPSFNESQVWIDPDRSSSVNNHYEHPQERCSIQQQTKSSCITHEKRGSYITQNICNFEESIRYSRVEEYEHKKFKKILGNDQCNQNSSDPNNLNLEDDELECGVFLSQLPEEIMNEKENKAREERRFLDNEIENDALRQLMSPDIQSLSKQTKTILFLGQDSQCGQTIQNIALNNPLVECSTSKDNFDVIFEEGRNPNQKKYQCNNCKQIFDQLSAFKQHMTDVASHARLISPRRFYEESNVDREFNYHCNECGKSFKTRDKIERHLEAHGNPDLECNFCHKVFATKFTLRTHKQIHARQYPCEYCFKAFSRKIELRAHALKTHKLFICEKCDFFFEKYGDLAKHIMLRHTTITVEGKMPHT